MGYGEKHGSFLSRREFLKYGGAAAAAGLAGGKSLSAFAAPDPTRPNVLFLAADDLRPDFGCLGNPVIKTPNIDRLAARGTIFSRVYCQMSLCNPCRSSLLSGIRPDTLKIYDQETHFRSIHPTIVTLPQVFKNAGYETLSVGKIFHNTLPDPASWSRPEPTLPLNYPYLDPETRARLQKRREAARALGRSDSFIGTYVRGPATESFDAPDNLYEDGAIADTGINLLRELKGKQPFFLAVGFISPHLPFVSPKKYWDLYDRGKIPMAENYFPPKGAPRFSLNPLTEFHCHEDFLDAPEPTEGLLPEAQARLLKHGYYASVSFVDAQVGRILDVLDGLGLRDNTIVVLLGDSGWKLGEHGGWGKFTNYEIDTRATLLVSAPGQGRPGQNVSRLVELVDLFPTLCELGGLKPPSHLEGASAAPLIHDPGRPWKTAAFSQFPRGFTNRYMGRAMRTDRYRYIEWRDWLDDSLIATELYDHAVDPQENINIAGASENAGLVQALAAQLKAGWPAALPK
jgi:arylsulfatase A-like enzyme